MRRALAASLLPAVAGLLALMASSAQLAASSPAAQKRFVGEVRAGDADTQAEEELWWHNAVIYQVYPRSFQDSDGDGIGDIKGITSRLAYLKEIGVGAVWLSPFYPSPQADFGYDISDFKNVDPQYGTLADFQEMVTTAHNLGMKVVADLVPNHSSDEHDWFIKSVAREAPYTDYYVWRDGKTDAAGNRIPPNNWVSHFRFSAWEWNEKRQQYYLHQFAVKQPDLNYDNANVVQEMKDVYTFWMDQGVDGFRVDALPFLFEEKYEEDEPLKENPSPNEDANDYSYYEHPYTMDKDGTYDMLQQWRKVVDSHPDGKPRVIMTECYTDFQNTIKYYGTKDNPGAHFTFNFQFISYLDASKGPAVFKQLIDQWMEAMEDWRKPNWVIGNHDNKRVETRFPNMADAMNMISLSLPGTAMTYYGEELGMSDAFISWEQTKDPQAVNAGQERYLQTSRDPCRTPMQWDGSVSAGFSKNPLTWMPTNPNYYNLNVEKERDDKRSHMNVYKALTTARQSITMRKGDYTATVIGDNVLMIQRSYPQSDTYLTIANVGSWEQEVKTSDLPAGTWSVYVSSGNSRLTAGSAVTSLSLRPKEAIILTNAAVSTTAPQTTTAPVGRSSTMPATVTSTQSSSGFAVRAVASLSIVLPLLCLRG